MTAAVETQRKGKLQAYAETVARRSIFESWRPTTQELALDGGLNEQQVTKVKQYARQEAAKLGVFWSFDPAILRFRACPDNAPVIAERMASYFYRTVLGSFKSADHLARGLEGMGYISSDVRDAAKKNHASAQRAIVRSLKAIRKGLHET